MTNEERSLSSAFTDRLAEVAYMIRKTTTSEPWNIPGIKAAITKAAENGHNVTDVALNTILAAANPANRTPATITHATPRVAVLPIPDDWAPDAEAAVIVTKSGKQVSFDTEAEKFKNHAQFTGRLAADWDAGFRNWLHEAVGRAPATRNPNIPEGW